MTIKEPTAVEDISERIEAKSREQEDSDDSRPTRKNDAAISEEFLPKILGSVENCAANDY